MGEDIVHVYNENYKETVDGDILNIIGIMDEAVKEMFKKFNPVKCMMTSRDTGLLNDYFSVTKSQLIDLVNFNTL